jgi:hypothetical protein
VNLTRGLLRLWALASVLWFFAVGGVCWMELRAGPFSDGWVTDVVVSKTREPVSTLKDNNFRDLVPVDQVMNLGRLLSALLVPPIGVFLLCYAFLWVFRGFRR